MSPKKRSLGVPAPTPSDCDFIWRQCLHRGHRVMMRSSGGQGPIQTDRHARESRGGLEPSPHSHAAPSWEPRGCLPARSHPGLRPERPERP